MNYKAGRVVEGASTITQQVARNLLPDRDRQQAQPPAQGPRGAARARDRAPVDQARRARDLPRLRVSRRRRVRHGRRRRARTSIASVARARSRAVGAARRARPGARAGSIRFITPRPRARDATRSSRAWLRAKLIDEPTRAAPPRHPDRAPSRRIELRHGRALVHRAGAPARSPARSPTSSARGGLVIETAALPGARHAARARRGRARAAVARRDGSGPAGRRGAVGSPHRLRRGVRRRARVETSGWRSVRSHDPGVSPAGLGVEAAGLRRRARSRRDHARHARCATRRSPSTTRPRTRTGSRSSSGKFRGVVLAQDAFAASLNAPAIDVFDRVGAGPVIALARKLGITTRARRRAADGARRVVRQADRARARVRDRSRAVAGRSRRVSRCACGAATRAVRRGGPGGSRGSIRRAASIGSRRTAGADPAERIRADGGQLLDERVAFQLDDMMTAVVERGTAATAGRARPPGRRQDRHHERQHRCVVHRLHRPRARCGVDRLSTSPSPSSAPKVTAPTPRCRCGSARSAPPKVRVRRLALPARRRHGDRVTIDRETGLVAAPHRVVSTCGFARAPRRRRSRGSPERHRLTSRTLARVLAER